MKRLVEYKMEDGSEIWVELDEPEGAGSAAPVMRGGKPMEKAKETFESALDKIKPAANAVISKLNDLADRPDEITVEFGIKLNTKVGFVLAAGVEANYKVALTWKKSARNNS